MWLHKEQFNMNIDTLKKCFDNLDQDLKESKYYVQVKNYLAVQEGKPFLDFELNDLDGNTYNLSSIAEDKVILIYFWASWCKPCREHNVKLKKLYEDNKSKGFEVLSISLDRDTTAFYKAIKEDGITWLNLLDRTGKYSVHDLYKNNAIPFNLLIEKNSK